MDDSLTPFVFLKPGDVVTAHGKTRLKTILGSCVAVALFDPGAGVGGLNHFLLPQAPPGLAHALRGRYGDTSLARLLDEILALGARPKHLRARILGGSGLIAHLSGEFHIGELNVAAARGFLERRDIRVVGEDVGGALGRHVTFDTADFTVRVRAIARGERLSA